MSVDNPEQSENDQLCKFAEKYNWQSDREFQLAVIMLRDYKAQASKDIEQAQIKGEIIGMKKAYRKAIMGAGEYHDDPYSYVVPIEHLKQYELDMAQFNVNEPIFRDKPQSKGYKLDEERLNG